MKAIYKKPSIKCRPLSSEEILAGSVSGQDSATAGVSSTTTLTESSQIGAKAGFYSEDNINTYQSNFNVWE